MTLRDRALAAAFAGVQLALMTGCGAPPHEEQPHMPPTPAPFTVSEVAPAWNVADKCDDRASRFAARGLWRDALRTGARDELVRWSAHYSLKHGECDVLIEHRLTLPDGFELRVLRALGRIWRGAARRVDRRSPRRRSSRRVPARARGTSRGQLPGRQILH